jgi:hypothetical protein
MALGAAATAGAHPVTPDRDPIPRPHVAPSTARSSDAIESALVVEDGIGWPGIAGVSLALLAAVFVAAVLTGRSRRELAAH